MSSNIQARTYKSDWGNTCGRVTCVPSRCRRDPLRVQFSPCSGGWTTNDSVYRRRHPFGYESVFTATSRAQAGKLNVGRLCNDLASSRDRVGTRSGNDGVFAKAGLENVPSHLGNAIRTAIVLGLSLTILWWSGEHQKTGTLTGRSWMLAPIGPAQDNEGPVQCRCDLCRRPATITDYSRPAMLCGRCSLCQR